MLPLVLGGIALAAVGYGVKEYCDSEGCPWDEEAIELFHKPQNISVLLMRKQKSLFHEDVATLQSMLIQINEKFTNIEPNVVDESQVSEANITNDTKKYMEIHLSILEDAQALVHHYVGGIETFLEKNISFAKASEEEQQLVKKAYSFVKKIHKYLDIVLCDASGNVQTKSIMLMMKGRSFVDKHTTAMESV